MNERFQKTFGKTAGYRFGMQVSDKAELINLEEGRLLPYFKAYASVVALVLSLAEAVPETCVRELINEINEPRIGHSNC